MFPAVVSQITRVGDRVSDAVGTDDLTAGRTVCRRHTWWPCIHARVGLLSAACDAAVAGSAERVADR